MTTLEFKGDWNITKGKVKQKFGILTDKDMVLVEGKYDEMLGRLQLILGRTKEELHDIISGL
ncbi:MAG: CsbD family protein [Bacteroidia bacterium]